jgi:hypothetical protein
MPTIREGIYSLLRAVQVDTKEAGRTHIEPWPSQRMVIDTVCDALANDVHEVAILKSRQMACTTCCSIIELFWALVNDGVQGAIIADRGDNLERLRRIFASLLETLPAEWRGPEHRITQNNRAGLAFANRSVIDLLAAAANPDLGASRALSMMHATECSLWKSLAGVESLKASLARINPNRLFLWESIANGFNWWHQFCEQAKVDRHMRFLFLGFWANPTYTIARDDPDFDTYMPRERGKYRLTDDEVARARYVKQHYNFTVQLEQIAWWRRESEFSAEEHMLRHYPWTAPEAFISSGTGFFPARRTLEINEALATAPPLYQGYKYVFEEQFLASRIEQVRDKGRTDDVTLRVWEQPDPQGQYVVGIDPSGGGGGDANDHAVEVLRCYADRCVQVAEFQSNKPLTYMLAWVLSHLCGAYRDHICNLEVSGIGAAVMPEVRNLRQLAERGILQAEPNTEHILNIIGSVRWFLYKRADTYTGAGSVINWKTNADNKSQIYSELRDSLMLRRLELRSPRLVQQMQSIVEEADGWIGAGPDTGEGDDLVSALVLAHHAWIEWRRPGLVARGLTWDKVHGERPPPNVGNVLSWAFSQHMSRIHEKAKRRPQRF